MNLNNKTFGKLEYNIGWIKKETIVFWGTEYNVMIRGSCDENEQPNDKQEQAYQIFKDNLLRISEESYSQAQNYISDSKEMIAHTLVEEKNIQDLVKFIKPIEILFFTTGNFAFVCEINGIEEELIILYYNGEIKIGGGFLIESLNLC